MSIVDPPSPARVGDALTAAMSRVDACPCGNTEPPRAAIPIDGGWRTSHLCGDCGRAWMADWKDD